MEITMGRFQDPLVIYLAI